MNIQIAESTDVRKVQNLIDEAIALGLRVVHRPEPVKSNVVSLDAKRQMMANVSAEA